MTIETKYNVHDWLWIMKGEKPVETKIKRIEIEVSTKYASDKLTAKISYVGTHGHIFKSEEKFYENQLFKTKEELLKSL